MGIYRNVCLFLGLAADLYGEVSVLRDIFVDYSPNDGEGERLQGFISEGLGSLMASFSWEGSGYKYEEEELVRTSQPRLYDGAGGKNSGTTGLTASKKGLLLPAADLFQRLLR